MGAAKISWKKKRLAAIDVGSNAVRLLIKDVVFYHDTIQSINHVAYFRVPLRLGLSAFDTGEMPPTVVDDLQKVMRSFQLLMKVQNVKAYRACATSALRSASNREDIIQRISRQSRISIECISGKEEADLILSNFKDFTQPDSIYTVCIDVGGGSTEVSILKAGECISRESFKLGTVRILKRGFDKSEWARLEKFVLVESPKQQFAVIGTGGNINRYHKLSTQLKGQPLPTSELKSILQQIRKVPVQDRPSEFGFKDNRSDVIVPAGEIYVGILDLIGANEIHVPKVGLSDGIIRQLAEADR